MEHRGKTLHNRSVCSSQCMRELWLCSSAVMSVQYVTDQWCQPASRTSWADYRIVGNVWCAEQLEHTANLFTWAALQNCEYCPMNLIFIAFQLFINLYAFLSQSAQSERLIKSCVYSPVSCPKLINIFFSMTSGVGGGGGCCDTLTPSVEQLELLYAVWSATDVYVQQINLNLSAMWELRRPHTAVRAGLLIRYKCLQKKLDS
jgi:hypothetical protein